MLLAASATTLWQDIPCTNADHMTPSIAAPAGLPPRPAPPVMRPPPPALGFSRPPSLDPEAQKRLEEDIKRQHEEEQQRKRTAAAWTAHKADDGQVGGTHFGIENRV